MAHVADLPGCIVRANSREQALEGLPEAIRNYKAWLHRHGEPGAQEEESTIEVVVKGETAGVGPFVSGDAAALFPPDLDLLSDNDLERGLRWLSYSRADLLALVNCMPDKVLDWQPDPHSRSIRRSLRHIGNAEEWYVSRIVPADTLPREWQDDEPLPTFEFLEMERRTAIARLRQLTAQQRSAVFYPTYWTDHPEEPWSARKALRRFLEHEQEHTAQIRDVLLVFRRHQLARLAAARADLLEQLVSLDEQTLTEVPACVGWTAKDVLVHVAAWDRWVLGQLRGLLAGGQPDLAPVRHINAFNEANVAAWKDRSLDEVVAELQEARRAWVCWMESLPEEEFPRSRPVGRTDWSPSDWVEMICKHEAGQHARHLAHWKAAQKQAQAGPKAVLLAALAAARDELLASAALVPPQERCTRQVCRKWTLQDVLGHVADWEEACVEGLRSMAAGRPPELPRIEDPEAWTLAHVETRRGQPWETAWSDLQHVHRDLLETLEDIDQTTLVRRFPGVWEPRTTPYAWALVALAHDRDHARTIRETTAGAARLSKDSPPKSFRARGKQ